MKSTLLESVSTRFSEICSDPLHFIATVLDPRYKDHYLDAEIKQGAREMIQAAMDAENPRGDGDGARTEQRPAQEIRAQKKRLVSLHQMRGMHPRCLICSVKSCKKVPQLIIIIIIIIIITIGKLFCS